MLIFVFWAWEKLDTYYEGGPHLGVLTAGDNTLLEKSLPLVILSLYLL